MSSKMWVVLSGHHTEASLDAAIHRETKKGRVLIHKYRYFLVEKTNGEETHIMTLWGAEMEEGPKR